MTNHSTTWRFKAQIRYEPDTSHWIANVPSISDLEVNGYSRDDVIERARQSGQGFLEVLDRQGLMPDDSDVDLSQEDTADHTEVVEIEIPRP